MAITRWEPFQEMSRMQDEISRYFGTPFWRTGAGLASREELGTGFMPPVDIYEDAEAITVTAELPGMDPKDVDLRIENGQLTLTGHRKLEREDKKDNYRRVERSYGMFTRTFTLPPFVSPETTKAEFKNGVLRVLLPKKEESRPRSIKVKVD